MSKEYYRKKIIDLRASMAKEKEVKKVTSVFFSGLGEFSFIRNSFGNDK